MTIRRALLAALCVVAFSGLSETASAQQQYPPSETITYTDFRGGAHTLRAFGGRRVRYCLPDSWLEAGGSQGLSPAELASLIEKTDSLYEEMLEVVGVEPQGSGLMKIAAVPLPAGGPDGALGIAVVGVKGFEISTATLPTVKARLAEGRLHEVIIHEQAHCFDVYRRYLGYYPDSGHSWTDLWIQYSEYLLRTGPYGSAPDVMLLEVTRQFTRKWDALGTPATWVRCVKPGSVCEAEGIFANRSYAGLLLRYERLHGPAAFRRVFEYYRRRVSIDNLDEVVFWSAERKNDVLAEALSFGINSDISGELDAWFWPVSQAARERLRQTYPVPNPFAVDADGDGWSPVRGDGDDYDPTIHPGATETVNGKDDDCNGVVDDVPRAAGTTLFTPPAKLTGRLRPEQRESYRFEAAGEFLIRTRATKGEWSGMIEIRREGEVNPNTRLGVGSTLIGVFGLRLESAGPWALTVIYNQTSGPEGDYEIVIAPMPRGSEGTGDVFALPFRASNSARGHVLTPDGLIRAIGTLPGAGATAADARPDAQGRWPTLLSGIEIRVAGRAATILAVRPTGADGYAVDFAVPPQVTPAVSGSRVPVVVRHVPSGAQWRLATAELLEDAPVFWSRPVDGQTFPTALALESPTLVAFDESNRVPTDGATRAMIFASGLGAARTPGNTRLVAQLADGSRLHLPVEHVGATSLRGLSQIIFKVDSALSGQARVLLAVEGGEEAWVALHLR
jgi:uncharacterized protein (TIGR03437 family)